MDGWTSWDRRNIGKPRLELSKGVVLCTWPAPTSLELAIPLEPIKCGERRVAFQNVACRISCIGSLECAITLKCEVITRLNLLTAQVLDCSVDCDDDWEASQLRDLESSRKQTTLHRHRQRLTWVSIVRMALSSEGDRVRSRHVPWTGFFHSVRTLMQCIVLPLNASKYYLMCTSKVVHVLVILKNGTFLVSSLFYGL